MEKESQHEMDLNGRQEREKLTLETYEGGVS